jgi:hypothetical protein
LVIRSLKDGRGEGWACRGMSPILGTTGTSIFGEGGGGGSGGIRGDHPGGMMACAHAVSLAPRAGTIAQTNRTIISFRFMPDMS